MRQASGVGGVGDGEYLVRPDEVHDDVVDDPAVLGAAQRVLRVPRSDLPQVGREAAVDGH